MPLLRVCHCVMSLLRRLSDFPAINPDSYRRALELTLAIIKPDATANPTVHKSIQEIILNNGFYFVRSRNLTLSLEDAARFYSIHEGQFFYNRLVAFMTSGPISVHILAREDAINAWRVQMGPTKSYRAQYEAPDSIRGQFGLTDTRNAVHGSDSVDSALREISFFFPSFDAQKWYAETEVLFKSKRVTFDEATCQHVPADRYS